MLSPERFASFDVESTFAPNHVELKPVALEVLKTVMLAFRYISDVLPPGLFPKK